MQSHRQQLGTTLVAVVFSQVGNLVGQIDRRFQPVLLSNHLMIDQQDHDVQRRTVEIDRWHQSLLVDLPPEIHWQSGSAGTGVTREVAQPKPVKESTGQVFCFLTLGMVHNIDRHGSFQWCSVPKMIVRINSVHSVCPVSDTYSSTPVLSLRMIKFDRTAGAADR